MLIDFAFLVGWVVLSVIDLLLTFGRTSVVIAFVIGMVWVLYSEAWRPE